MITSYLQGGLGNQLFQISAAIALALENNDKTAFDIKNHDLPKQGRKCEKYLTTIFRNLNFSSNLPIKHVYREPRFSYDKIAYETDMCLVGYFQSEKYFDKYASEIRKLFSMDNHSRNVINNKYGEILANNTVAVHVRRGDYVKFSETHPPCSLKYYNEAITTFAPNTTFLFFSDDIAWCKKNFVQDNFIFIEENEDLVDLYLISMCCNAILSNSSFSWWGAWLNNKADKRIIAPKNWFGPTISHNTKDLIPSHWETL